MRRGSIARVAVPARLGLAVALAGPALPAPAAEMLPPRLYQVTTETGMPHLEDNLHYATTRERRCLTRQALATAFPVLAHAALAGCSLDHETREGETVSYVLSCEGGHGTTGEAHWRLGPATIAGTLQVKLGGKNMTFYQRVTALPLGDCRPEAN